MAAALTLFLIGAVLFCYSYIKQMKLKELQDMIGSQILQIGEINSQLNKRSLSLDKSRRELAVITLKVRDEMKEIEEDKRTIKNIIEENNRTLAENELLLFNIKESMLNTIRDYRRVSKLLGKALDEDDDEHYNHMYDMLVGCKAKEKSLEQNFTDNFKMTPDEYSRKRTINNTDFSEN